MNLLLNGTAIPAPFSLTSSWVTVSGQLLRQERLYYPSAPAATAAAVLAPCVNPAGVNLTFTDPATNAPATLVFHCVEATAEAERDNAGAIHYAPLSVTLRQAAT